MPCSESSKEGIGSSSSTTITTGAGAPTSTSGTASSALRSREVDEEVRNRMRKPERREGGERQPEVHCRHALVGDPGGHAEEDRAHHERTAVAERSGGLHDEDGHQHHEEDEVDPGGNLRTEHEPHGQLDHPQTRGQAGT